MEPLLVINIFHLLVMTSCKQPSFLAADLKIVKFASWKTPIKFFCPLTFQPAHDEMKPHYQILPSVSDTSLPIGSKETVQIYPKSLP